jgi:hypothetical protein
VGADEDAEGTVGVVSSAASDSLTLADGSAVSDTGDVSAWMPLRRTWRGALSRWERERVTTGNVRSHRRIRHVLALAELFPDELRPNAQCRERTANGTSLALLNEVLKGFAGFRARSSGYPPSPSPTWARWMHTPLSQWKKVLGTKRVVSWQKSLSFHHKLPIIRRSRSFRPRQFSCTRSVRCSRTGRAPSHGFAPSSPPVSGYCLDHSIMC